MKNEDVLAMLVRMGSEFMEYYRLIQSMDSKLERMERILDHFDSLERMEKLLDAFEDQNWYMKDYLTVREVSEYVGLPASRIRRMTEERAIVGVTSPWILSLFHNKHIIEVTKTDTLKDVRWCSKCSLSI